MDGINFLCKIIPMRRKLSGSMAEALIGKRFDPFRLGQPGVSMLVFSVAVPICLVAGFAGRACRTPSLFLLPLRQHDRQIHSAVWPGPCGAVCIRANAGKGLQQ
jgi:hypothetical protein